MKNPHDRKMSTILGCVCLLMTSPVFGSVAKADAVLDWNAIAISTIGASGQSPFAQARFGVMRGE